MFDFMPAKLKIELNIFLDVFYFDAAEANISSRSSEHVRLSVNTLDCLCRWRKRLLICYSAASNYIKMM